MTKQTMKEYVNSPIDESIMNKIKRVNKAFEPLPIGKEKIMTAACGGILLMMQIMMDEEGESITA